MEIIINNLMNINTDKAQLSRTELHRIVSDWMKSWNDHDLDTVMSLFSENAVFESWTGAIVTGKKRIRTAWANWFLNHGNFHFEIEDTVVDEQTQNVVISWKLDWLNPENIQEIRHGIDFLHFENAFLKIKRSYSQPPKK